MSRRPGGFPLSKQAGTIIGVALAVVLLVLVYVLRSSAGPVAVEGSGPDSYPVNLSSPQVSLAAVEEFPVQVLPPAQDPEGGVSPGLPSPSGSSGAPSSDSSTPGSSSTSGSSALPSPGGSSSAPRPSSSTGSSTGPTTAPSGSSSASSPAPTPVPSRTVVPPSDVPSGSTVVTMWLDGWSIAALGSSTVQASYVGSSESFPITFSPLTAAQVSSAAGSFPKDVSRYLSRLVTPKAKVSCAASGCSAGGAPLDPSVLASLDKVPNLGATYSGAGLTYGLYAARVAVPNSESILVLESPGTPFSLTRATDASGAPLPWPSTVPLSYGFGYLFTLDPLWGADSPQRWSWDALPYTPDAAMFYDSNFSALFAYGLADTYPSSVFTSASPSLLSYLTSPTVACGIAPLCVAGEIEPTISEFTASSGSRCLADASGARGRVALLQQDFTAEVDLPYPILLPGVSASSDPSNAVFTSDTLSMVSGSVSFKQRSTFIADESSLYSFAAARDAQDPSVVAWDRVLPDQLRACPSE